MIKRPAWPKELITVQPRSLRFTFGLFLAGLVLIGLLSVGASLWAIQRKENDALIMNLAGRQRVLIQKTAKEALLGLQTDQRAKYAKYIDQMHSTAHRFEQGLTALMEGGKLTYAGRTITLPPPSRTRFGSALEEVKVHWESFYQTVHTVLKSEPGSTAQRQAIKDLERHSGLFLKRMDQAVRIYQEEAETGWPLSGGYNLPSWWPWAFCWGQGIC